MTARNPLIPGKTGAHRAPLQLHLFKLILVIAVCTTSLHAESKWMSVPPDAWRSPHRAVFATIRRPFEHPSTSGTHIVPANRERVRSEPPPLPDQDVASEMRLSPAAR